MPLLQRFFEKYQTERINAFFQQLTREWVRNGGGNFDGSVALSSTR